MPPLCNDCARLALEQVEAVRVYTNAAWRYHQARNLLDRTVVASLRDNLNLADTARKVARTTTARHEATHTEPRRVAGQSSRWVESPVSAERFTNEATDTF